MPIGMTPSFCPRRPCPKGPSKDRNAREGGLQLHKKRAPKADGLRVSPTHKKRFWGPGMQTKMVCLILATRCFTSSTAGSGCLASPSNQGRERKMQRGCEYKREGKRGKQGRRRHDKKSRPRRMRTNKRSRQTSGRTQTNVNLVV